MGKVSHYDFSDTVSGCWRASAEVTDAIRESRRARVSKALHEISCAACKRWLARNVQAYNAAHRLTYRGGADFDALQKQHEEGLRRKAEAAARRRETAERKRIREGKPSKKRRESLPLPGVG